MSKIVFIDSEIGLESGKILDLGAVKQNHEQFHAPNINAFMSFVSGNDLPSPNLPLFSGGILPKSRRTAE